jgi:4-amino-4-deoxy-L-arabinose transferase-like glycosyltransferase
MSGAARAHVRPPYFYFLYLPLHLLPATLFTLGGVLRRLRRRGNLEPSERFAYDASIVWLGSGFLLLSVATTKRPIYLLPFFPAAAIAGGFWLEAFLQRQANGLYERAMELLLPLTLILAAAAVPCGAAYLHLEVASGVAEALVGLGAALGAWIASRRGRRGTVLFLWGAGVAVTLFSALHSIVPPVDAMKSLRSVSIRVASIVPMDRAIHAINPDETTEGMIPFYAGRALVAIPTPTQLESRLSELGEIYLLTVDKSCYSRESPEWKKTQYGSVEHLPHEVLLEDLGNCIGSRAFRLLRFRR